MTIAKVIGNTVLLLAITIGGIGKFIPHLFFKVPNGFILWALTGHPLPPFIIPGPFEKGNTDWLKDGDLIVSAAPKSGTTWMLFCSHQIRVKGNDEQFPYADVSLNTPWPELIQTPGDTWEIQREKYNNTVLADGTLFKHYWDHPEYPFRIFKSHNLASGFASLIANENPPKKIKFIAMARPALDQIASFIPFFVDKSDEFRKMWGGFPPVSIGKNAREQAQTVFSRTKPGNKWFDMTLPYVKSWWEVKDEDNVLLLHYSDAVKNLDGTVKTIADFLDVELTPEQHDKIVDKCSYKYMKGKQHLFEYQLPLNRDFDGKRIVKSGSMIRKGTNGDGKVYFTDEEIAAFNKQEEDPLQI